MLLLSRCDRDRCLRLIVFVFVIYDRSILSHSSREARLRDWLAEFVPDSDLYSIIASIVDIASGHTGCHLSDQSCRLLERLEIAPE